MDHYEEARTLRERQKDVAKAFDTVDVPPQGNSSMVVRIIDDGNFPTVAQSYYAVQRVVIGGVEAEGNDGTFTLVGGVFFALNGGGAIPPPGTDVIVESIGGRYVFAYN